MFTPYTDVFPANTSHVNAPRSNWPRASQLCKRRTSPSSSLLLISGAAFWVHHHVRLSYCLVVVLLPPLSVSLLSRPLAVVRTLRAACAPHRADMSQKAAPSPGSAAAAALAARTSGSSRSPAASAALKRKRGQGTKFYAVKDGFKPGVYLEWKECLQQITGFKGAVCTS